MLSFDFTYWLAGLVALVPAGVSTVLCLHINRNLPNSDTTRPLFWLVLSSALWQFAEGFTRLSGDHESAIFWGHLINCSVIPIGSISLHFALAFIRSKWIKSIWLHLILYAPAVVFLFLDLAGYIGREVQPDPFWNWTIQQEGNLLLQIELMWIAFHGVLALSTLLWYAWRMRDKEQNLKTPALLLAFGYTLPAIQGITTQIILPIFFGMSEIPLTTSSILIFTSAAVIAVQRYDAFKYHPLQASSQLVESMNEGVVIVDNDGIIRYCNDQFARITGYTKKEIIGSGGEELLMIASDSGKMKARISDRSEGKSEKYEIQFKTKSGSLIDTLISASPYHNQKGDVIGSISVHLDITERKRAEQKLQFADSVLQNIDNCVLAANQNGDIIYASPSVYSKFGFTEEQVLGDGWLNVTCKESEDIDTKKKYLSDAAQGLIDCSTPYETWIENVDGGSYCMLWQDTIAPGNIVIGTGIDITRRVEAEGLLKEKNKELESFIYKVSHDLRGPLTSSVGLVNLARKQEMTQETAQFIELINESLGRLQQILTELTELAVIRQGELKHESIDMEALIEATLMNYKDYPVYENLDVSIENDLKVPIESDSSLVKVILRNLLENAVKYQKANVKDNAVRISIGQNGSGVKLEIADNGIGIPEDMQPRIFDVFVRATENSKGTGMGLYIVKNAVDKLGGSIQVKSKPKEGSTFTVHIPYSPSLAG